MTTLHMALVEVILISIQYIFNNQPYMNHIHENYKNKIILNNVACFTSYLANSQICIQINNNKKSNLI